MKTIKIILRLIKRNKALTVILLVSFLLRLLFAIDTNKELFRDITSYLNQGKSIASTGISSLSAYHAPAYPLLIGLVFFLFDTGSILAVTLFQCILGTASTWLVYAITNRTAGGRPGLLAAAISLLCWPLTLYSGILLSETLFIFLLLLSVYLFFLSTDKNSLALVVLTGVTFGLSTLTRSINLPASPLVALLYIIGQKLPVNGTPREHRGKQVKRGIARASVFIAAFVLTLSPWAIRNYFKYNEVILIDTLGGLNLYIGNNPSNQSGLFMDISNDPVAMMPDNVRKQEAISYILHNKATFITVTLKRAKYFLFWESKEKVDWILSSYLKGHKVYGAYFFPDLIYISSLVFWGLGYLGIPFLIKYPRGRVIFCIMFYFFATTSVFYISARYRMPVMPFLALSGAVAVNGIADFAGRIRQRALRTIKSK